jgi:hypothetical protein
LCEFLITPVPGEPAILHAPAKWPDTAISHGKWMLLYRKHGTSFLIGQFTQQVDREREIGIKSFIITFSFFFITFNGPADTDIVDPQVIRNLFHRIAMLHIRSIDQFVTACALPCPLIKYFANILDESDYPSIHKNDEANGNGL